MTAKTYLKEIVKMQETIRTLREKTKSLGGTDYSRTRVQGGEAGGAYAGVERLIDMENRYAEMIAVRIGQINALSDPDFCLILKLRYVDGVRSWIRIADRVGLSDSTTLRKHGAALREFEQRFPEILEMSTK